MAYGRGKFKGKGKKKDSGWVRITKLFKKDRDDLPDFLTAKWSVVLRTEDDEYFDQLVEVIEKAKEEGALILDVSKSKDDNENGDLVLSACAFEPKENGKRSSKKKSRDDDEDEKPAKKKGKSRRDEEED